MPVAIALQSGGGLVYVREGEWGRGGRGGGEGGRGGGESDSMTAYLGEREDDSAPGLVNSVVSPPGLALGGSGFCSSSSRALTAFRKGSKNKLASF